MTVIVVCILLCILAFVPMIGEARLSARHEIRLRQLGALEPAGDVIHLMQVAYPAGFLAMIVEAWIRDARFGAAFLAGAILFVAAKSLKYWAIATLGERWTFRVLVPPGSSRILDGPYRILRHPNYLAVVGEFAGFAIMAHAWVAGPLATVLFASLIRARLRVEEKALGRAA